MLQKTKIIVVVLAVLIAVVFLFIKLPDNQNSNSYQSPPPFETRYEAINGRVVEKAIADLRPLAVVVENHPDARPQSGLSEADIVYESLAEGGITRFLAIFQSPGGEEIGPVRSAREYFASLADEWGALFAHVGGSNEVITQLKAGRYKNLDDANEYYNFDFFPRRKDKPEPHHIFTSTQKLKNLIKYHQFSGLAVYQPWIFKEDQPVASSTASKVSIDFSRPGYEVGWEYDSLRNAYKRLQYFQPHIDAISKTQILAKAVVVQIVRVTPVPKDPLLQVDIGLNEGGRALVFQDGIVVNGTWRRENGRTRFYDSVNAEIEFNRGSIWLELVPKDKAQNLKWN